MNRVIRRVPYFLKLIIFKKNQKEGGLGKIILVFRHFRVHFAGFS